MTFSKQIVSQWKNKLMLCFFRSVRKTVAYPKLYINIKKIERVDSFIFLGLQINHNLNWNKHIRSISFKKSLKDCRHTTIKYY